MPTVATGLARVRRVHEDQTHTGSLRLVGDEGAKLEERPTVQHSPLALNRSLRVDALPNSFEVFEGNPARSALRRLHNGLADTVVDITSEAPFPAAALFEQPPGALGLLLLELRSESRHSGHAPC